MRTIDEKEAIEIAEVIHEFGKKLYSKKGAKFLKEAKKFLNEEPCWVEEELIHSFFGTEQICIIGGPKLGLHTMGFHRHYSAGEIFILHEEPCLLELLSESNRRPDIATILERLERAEREFESSGLHFPLELLEKLPIPFVAQRLGEEFVDVDLQVILRTENNFLRDHCRNNQNAFQRKYEHYFRSKSHFLKTCNARVFRGPWLARGNIAQV